MTDAKLVRFAAVVVVLAAYAFVFRTGEARIAERLDDNARIAERVRAGEYALASRPRIEAQRTRARSRLRAVELDADRSALVARFLREAARIAATHHATIPAITASATMPVSAAISTQAPATESLEAIPLELTIEGRYADVLATTRALSRSRVLASVDVASLARKHADGADATLTTALHVLLQRFAPSPAARPTDPAVVPGSAGVPGPADVRAGRG